MRFFDLVLAILYAAIVFLIVRHEGFRVPLDVWSAVAAIVILVTIVGAFALDQLAYNRWKKRQRK
jgi:hypothetical protein